MTLHTSTTARFAVRNTVWLTFFSYVSQFVAFIATIVLARLLGPQVFGVFAIGIFWSSLLALRSKLGLTYAGIRQPQLDGELLGTYYRLDLTASAGSLLLGIAAAILLPHLGYAPEVGDVVLVMMIVEFLPALIGPMALALEKEMQLGRMSLVSLVSNGLAYGMAILLALSGVGLWSLLVLNLVNAIVGMIGVYWVYRWRVPHVRQLRRRFSPSMAKRLLKQGISIGLANMGQSNIVNQYDKFLIGTFVSTTTLGFYDRAYRLSQWPNILLTSVLSRVGLVTFARVQDDLQRLTHAMRLSMWVLTTLGVPISLALLFGGSDIILILYGPQWVESAYFLRFLATYSLLSPFISLGGSLAYAVGNIRVMVFITVAQVITILSAATLLTLAFGAIGTVAGVGMTIAVGFGISARYIFKRLPLSFRQVFGAPVLAAGIGSLVTLLVANLSIWPTLPGLIRLLVTLSTSAGLYLICLMALEPKVMLERVRYVIRTFRGTNAK